MGKPPPPKKKRVGLKHLLFNVWVKFSSDNEYHIKLLSLRIGTAAFSTDNMSVTIIVIVRILGHYTKEFLLLTINVSDH